MANYWFFVLGLDFDDSPDIDTAKGVITKKANYWNDDLQAIGRYASYYASLAEQTAQMRKDLSSKAGIDSHAQIAADIAFPVVDRLLSETVSGGDKAINPGKVSSMCNLARTEIARKCSLPFVEISDELMIRRARKLGISISGSDQSARAAELYRKVAIDEPEGMREFRSVETDLIPLGKRSLYDFACPDGVGDPRSLSSNVLITQAHSVLSEFRMSPALRSASEKLIPYMDSIIGNEVKRAQYNRYLQWRDVNEALDSAGQMAELSGGVLGGWVAVDAHKRITAALGSASDADLVLAGYCASHEPRLVYNGVKEAAPESSADQGPDDKKRSTISLDVDSLSLKVGEIKCITITASGEHLTWKTSNKSVVDARWERAGNLWTLVVKGLSEGQASIDVGVVEDAEQLGCYAPTVDVVVTEVVRKNVKIEASVRQLELTVGQQGFVKFTSDGNEAFSASVGGILRNCVSWHEDGSNTLVIEPSEAGTEKIGVRTKQNAEYNESNYIEILVKINPKKLRQPSLTFASPKLQLQGNVQKVVLQRGETAPVQVITDTDGEVNAQWSNFIINAQWSQQPSDNTIFLTAVRGGSTTLTFTAPQTSECYGILPVSVSVVVRETMMQKIKSAWKGSGLLGKGCMLYAVYVVVTLVACVVQSIVGSIVGN